MSFDQTIRSQASQAETETSLGVTLGEQGKLVEAILHLRAAVRLRPDFAKAHHNLGVALAQQGNDEEAVRSLRQTLQLKPDYTEAYYNLGSVLMSQGKHADAVDCYYRALGIKPDHYEVYNNLGLALTELGRLGEAVVILQQAVRLRPNSAEAHTNLGLALAEQGKYGQAEDCYQQALRINPSYAEAHGNLANNYKEQGLLEEALASYDLALRLKPDLVSAHWNRSLAWLQKGDYERGWVEYEWRWQRKQTPKRPFTQPLWDGSPLAERSILLYMEQGLGDMLQFIRYARLVKERGGTVIVECPPFLMPLFSFVSGIDRLVGEDQSLPGFDVQAPLMSLPRLLGTTLANIPAEVPYLHAEGALAEEWARKLSELRGFKIGIAWQGNRHHKWDRFRSIPLAEFEPLARLRGVRLISLQKGYGTEQLRANRFPVTELADELDASAGAFMDTAAIMKNLDLVITTDTALAHLAGGLGMPVWMALSAIADWRWLTGRDDSPWYPTMRLFRQTKLGDWSDVFERLTSEVAKLLDERCKPIFVEMAPGELIDRITILEIKSERITDADKLAHVRAELAALLRARDQAIAPSSELATLTAQLKSVNEALWQVEDDVRVCEQAQAFGPRFIELARAVYRHNDHRAQLKRQISELLGAPFIEQKIYQAAGQARCEESNESK
jgi:Tfp pilus assembly protein PilF